MSSVGPGNRLTDVAGLLVGNAEDHAVRTGVTVVLAEQPAVAAVDVRGGSPGTRETDALQPGCPVERIEAVVLAGGSAFGLDAAGAVQAELARQGRGFAVGPVRVPVVPSAILFDLLNGGAKDWGEESPYRTLGRQALAAAARDFAMGNAGAGLGATAGPLKGGLGSASLVTGDGRYTVAALAAVNPFGSATLPDSPLLWAWPFERDGELGHQRRLLDRLGDLTLDYQHPLGDDPTAAQGANTTLAVVATDAVLDRPQAQRLAIMAQDGFARALRPVHTPFDGDTVFALATGRTAGAVDAAALGQLGGLAADCLARAIARGVFSAASVGPINAYRAIYADFFPD